MNKLIVVEGLSGTGKTTVAKLLAEKMGASFYATPPEPFCSVREQVDTVGDYLSRFFFYLSGNLLASKEIREMLTKADVVCDRYIYATLCYHKAFGVDVGVADYLFDQIVLPSYLFLITCNEDVRMSRMKMRGMTTNDLDELNRDVDQKVLVGYRKFNPVEIDNSANDPAMAVEQILAHIKGG